MCAARSMSISDLKDQKADKVNKEKAVALFLMNCGRDTDDVIDLSLVIHLTDYKSQIDELQTSKMLADGLFLNIVIHWSDFFLV